MVVGDGDIAGLPIVKSNAILKDELAEGMKNIGDLEGIKGVDRLANRMAKTNNYGHFFEAKRARALKIQAGVSIKELDIGLGRYGVDGEADIIFKVSQNGKEIIIMEEVKHRSNGVLKMDNDLANQINRYAQIKNNFDEIRIVTNGVATQEVIDRAQSHGIKVIQNWRG